jgi:hypothetical protein
MNATNLLKVRGDKKPHKERSDVDGEEHDCEANIDDETRQQLMEKAAKGEYPIDDIAKFTKNFQKEVEKFCRKEKDGGEKPALLKTKQHEMDEGEEEDNDEAWSCDDLWWFEWDVTHDLVKDCCELDCEIYECPGGDAWLSYRDEWCAERPTY